MLAGDVDHAIGFCSNRISTKFQWPARRSDGVVTSPDAMPMGTWIRLRSDADTSGFGPGRQHRRRGLREHGAILTDTCAHPFHLLAENSSGWNDDDLQAAAHAWTRTTSRSSTPHSMRADTTSLRIR